MRRHARTAAIIMLETAVAGASVSYLSVLLLSRDTASAQRHQHKGCGTYMALLYLIAPIVGAVVIALVTSWRLAWRLLLFVPLAAQIVMFAYPSNDPHAFSIRGAIDRPEALVWIPIIYLVAVIFFGTWAVIIGGFGWIAVRFARLAGKYSLQTMLVAGSVAGAIVGAGFSIVTWGYAVYSYPNIPVPSNAWAGAWLAASVVAGSVGGLLVAYYAAVDPQDSQAVPNRHAAVSRT